MQRHKTIPVILNCALSLNLALVKADGAIKIIEVL